MLWDLEAAFIDRPVFNQLMDEVIERELLPGNTAQEPKKRVRILMCADFEDSHIPEEKFFHWTPVHMKMLPKFRLCHASYWDPSNARKDTFPKRDGFLEQGQQLQLCEYRLKQLAH